MNEPVRRSEVVGGDLGLRPDAVRSLRLLREYGFAVPEPLRASDSEPLPAYVRASAVGRTPYGEVVLDVLDPGAVRRGEVLLPEAAYRTQYRNVVITFVRVLDEDGARRGLADAARAMARLWDGPSPL
jgi:hypothetical protein